MIVIMIIFKRVAMHKRQRGSVWQREVDIKRLVMTGKEHEVPRAVFFFFSSQACANHLLLFLDKK